MSLNPRPTSEQVRAELAKEPAILAIADALRNRFNASLRFLEADSLTLGNPEWVPEEWR